MNIKLSKDVIIPAREYAGQGNAILGIRDSGKSYSATYMAEQLLQATVPFVAFDPIGVWRFLKVDGAGKGFPVVVAGGEGADLPLTAHNAAEIVRAAMVEGVPLVLDLYDMKLSKADWRRIVQESVSLLLYENKKYGVRHLFFEEAAEFCPQRLGPDAGRVYAEIEKLARMGGNAGLGYTLINQRAEEVNKAVLELCDCLFLHRQKGKNSLISLGKWLDAADAQRGKEIVKSLPGLPQGECWVWLQGSDEPRLVKMPAKRSFHPDRRNPQVAASKGTADVGSFVAALKTALPRLEEERAANDPVALKRRIKELEKQLADPARGVNVSQLEAEAHRSGVASERARWAMFADQLVADATGEFKATMERITRRIETEGARAIPGNSYGVPKGVGFQKESAQGVTLRKEITLDWRKAAKRPVVPVPNPTATGGMRRMMVALAQRSGLTARQLGVRAGLSSSSGTFGTYLAKLRTNGWIEGGRDGMALTPAGTEALGAYDPLPTGRDLLDHWLRELGSGGAARMLSVLADAYPRALTKQDLGAEAGISHTSGTFGTYLSKLRTLELIEGKTELKLNDELA